MIQLNIFLYSLTWHNIQNVHILYTTMFTRLNIDKNPCRRFRRYCPLIDRTGVLISTHTGRRYHSMKHANCQSSNLIYVITCEHCGIQYVGQTKNRILQRFQGHIFDISHNTNTTVARHFNQCPIDSPKLHSA